CSSDLLDVQEFEGAAELVSLGKERMAIATEEDLELRIEEISHHPLLFFIFGEFLGRPIRQNHGKQAFAVLIQFLVIELGPDARSHKERDAAPAADIILQRSEEHTSELQSPDHLVCRLLLEKK